MYSSIIAPKTAEIEVCHQSVLGVDSYDLNELYSPDTEFWKSKVLDLGSPKYEPNKTYIFDRSRYRNHGTIVGAIWVRNSKGVWGLSFDGDDYVNCGDKATLDFAGDSTFSITAWIYGTDFTTSAFSIVTKFGWVDIKGWNFYIENTTGKPEFFVNQGYAQRTTANYPLSLLTWYKVTVVKSSTNPIKMFISGAERAYTAQNNGQNINSPAGLECFVGDRQDASGGSYVARGRIFLPRVYSNYALSEAEDRAHFRQERHLFGV